MRTLTLRLSAVACVLGASLLHGQATLNTRPSRVLGQPRLEVQSNSPNLVEGREFNTPYGIAVDSTVTPPVLYVADSNNHRILGWKNATAFTNGAKADFVIGQIDFLSTGPGGPGSAFSTGLRVPTGLVVDKDGNLYVLDAGNNRILRYARPHAETNPLPNLVIGQSSFTTSAPNLGGISEKTINTNNGQIFAAGVSLALDNQGNLWLVDTWNSRILRYPASALTSEASNGPAADIVLGQLDFSSNVRLQATGSNRPIKTGLSTPSGLMLDAAGNLYVADSIQRVVVYTPPFNTGKEASRIMGILAQNAPAPCPGNAYAGDILIAVPEGLFAVNNQIGVIDKGNHRIMVFDPYDQWPAESTQPSPRARAIGPMGQNDFCSQKVNRGLPIAANNAFDQPSAAVIAGGDLFVTDTGNNRVVVFPVGSIGSAAQATRLLGQDAFHLTSPNLVEGREFFLRRGNLADAGIAIDTVSDPPRLYVADTFNNRVLGFRDARRIKPGDQADLVIGQPDMQHTLVNYPSSDVDRPTARSLFAPTGVAVDSEGNLYVADNGNGRVLRFAKPFSQTDPIYPTANLVLGQGNFTTKITDPLPNRMRAPYGLAWASNNGLLVSDSAHHRVLYFRGKPADLSSGQSAALVFGQPDFATVTSGNADNKMNSPHHISTDSGDRLYVADTSNNRILIFNHVPSAETNPRAATILPNLQAPRGIFVSQSTGEIWTTEANNARALRFPDFDKLAISGNASNFTLPIPGGFIAMAVAQDGLGALYLAESANRISVFYPAIGSVTNAASFFPGRALAPGTLATIKPQQNLQFAEAAEVVSTAVWPKEMQDIQVLVNDVLSPLSYVGMGQINFQVPYGTPASGQAEIQVQKKSTGQILAAGLMEMNSVSPGFFTASGTGSGQLAALNEDNTVNSGSNPVERGKIIILYGTGYGVFPGLPADGDPNPGALDTPEKPRVVFAAGDGEVLYSGLAPGFPGLWQINVRVPMAVPPSNAVRLSVLYKSIFSNDAQRGIISTIAVK